MNKKAMIKFGIGVFSDTQKYGSADDVFAAARARFSDEWYGNKKKKYIPTPPIEVWRLQDKMLVVLLVVANKWSCAKAARSFAIPENVLNFWVKRFVRAGVKSLMPMPLWRKQKRDSARNARYWRKCYGETLAMRSGHYSDARESGL